MLFNNGLLQVWNLLLLQELEYSPSFTQMKWPTWQDSPVHKCKVLLEPGVAEVIDIKVPLDKKHVLKQRSGRVAAVSHPFVEGPICDLLQQDHGLLHDCQHLLGPQVSFLKVAWKKKVLANLITTP